MNKHLKEPHSSVTATATAPRGLVVKGGQSYRARQGPDYNSGVSADTVGSRVLWLGMVTLPPARRTTAHVHEFHESAFYMLSGDEVELWTGTELEHCDRVHPGDYLFIPPNVLHVAVNRSSVPAVFIGCRSEPTAEESLALRPEMDGRVP
jgi:uncharacterized RmlC-like cupin family protein